jgi:hypothetical protein
MGDVADRDYLAELKAVAARVEEEAQAAIRAGYRTYEEELTSVGRAYLLYRYVAERGDVNRAPVAIRILYSKIASCIAGTLHLLERGYAGPSAMVARGVFETSVHLQVILKEDTAERSRLFEEFLFVERHQDYVGATPEQVARNQADFERVRANYHPTRPRSWCWKHVQSKRLRKGIPDNPSLRDLCEHIGHAEYYDNLYPRLSAAIHAVPSYELWVRNAKSNMVLGPNFTINIPLIANLVAAIAGDALVRVIHYLAVPDEVPLGTFVLRVLSPRPVA